VNHPQGERDLGEVSQARITGVDIRMINVPLGQPLETAAGVFPALPMVLVDLETDAGVTGCAYFSACFLPMMLKPIALLIDGLSEMIIGDRLAPAEIDQKLRRNMRLVGAKGPVASAMAVIEIATWDALAKHRQLPLCELLGGARQKTPIYQTIVSMDPQTAAEKAIESIEVGYGGVKCKLGQADPQADIALLTAVRAACGDGYPIMGDFNQALSVDEAEQRMESLDELNLTWVEEPTLADDFEGHARITEAARTPVSIGENWQGIADAQRSLSISASDLVMPDVIRMGGITAWLEAAHLADEAGVGVSSHGYSEICVHLLAVAARSQWLEHVDVLDEIFLDPIKPTNGVALPSPKPGVGISWNEDAIRRFLVKWR